MIVHPLILTFIAIYHQYAQQIHYSYYPYPQQIFMLSITTLLLMSVLTMADKHPQAKLPIVDYCKYFRYPVESHKVITQDGYILTLFRIQKKNSVITEGLKPIILQHGLLDSSDTWLVNDENKAPGFMLANKGYDVWLGNSRGNKHSRAHTHLNPDKDKQFWEFTFQHMGQYDLPAVFSYIHNLTQQKVSYIGHSQGTVQMHIALSINQPTVEAVLDKYFGFGPVATVGHANSHLVDLLDKSGLVQWYHLRHIYEFLPSFGWFQTDAGVLFCHQFAKVCGDFMGQICDDDPSLDNYQRYDVIVGHNPSGTSVMNMEHWKQAFDRKHFQAFDYGNSQKNIEHYGQSTPPVWDLSKVRVPIRLFAGSTDLLADPTDVQWLWNSLSSQAKEFYKTYTSGHVTFVWGLDVSPWMNDVFKMLAQ